MTYTEQEAAETGEIIGISWEEADFTPIDLARGMDVETEHGSVHELSDVGGDDPETAAKIAWVHLLESPIYYDLLEEMESQFDQEERTAAASITVPYSELLNPANWKIIDAAFDMEYDVEPYEHKYEIQIRDVATGSFTGYALLEGNLEGHPVKLELLLEGHCEGEDFYLEHEGASIEKVEPAIMIELDGTIQPIDNNDAEAILIEMDALDKIAPDCI